jgi:hypothetical protein
MQNYLFQHFDIVFPRLTPVNATPALGLTRSRSNGGGTTLAVADRTSWFECPVATGFQLPTGLEFSSSVILSRKCSDSC